LVATVLFSFARSLTIARRDWRHAVCSPDRPLSVLALLTLLFASLLAESCLVFDTNFWDCRTVCASFAFARAVISPLSPVLGISLLLNERSSRSRSAGDRPPSPETAHQMVTNSDWHVCSELLTVARSPIPVVHDISCHRFIGSSVHPSIG